MLAVLLSICIPVADTAAQQRPYTIDDYLALEDTGSGATDPTGRWIVWEQAPPYDQLPDYGVGRFGAWGEAFRVKAVDLSMPRPEASLLFEYDPQGTYRLDDFSPDGRYLTFYSVKDGSVNMGAYDFKQRRVHLFDAAPRVDYGGVETVWISSDEFVFAAYPEGRQPWLVIRPYTGKRLQEEWTKAWDGKIPSVSEVTSHASCNSAFLSGRMIKANARTGEMEMLANGVYETLVPSADGHFLAALQQAARAQPDPSRTDIDWVMTRSQLVIFDLATGQPSKIIAPAKDVFPGTLAWASNSNSLAFFTWDVGQGVRSGIFNAADATTGTVTPYPHVGLDLVSERERGFYQKPERVVWLDGRLAVFAREIRDGDLAPRLTYRDIAAESAGSPLPKADWFLLGAAGDHQKLTSQFEEISAIPLDADGHSITVLADGDAWRLTPDKPPANLSVKIKHPMSHPDAVRFSTAHPPFRGHVTLVARNEKAPSFALLDLRTGDAAVIAAPASDAELLASSVPGRSVLLRLSSDAGAALVLKRADAKPVVLAKLNAHLSQIAKTEWRTIRYAVSSKEGKRMVDACVLLPPNYERGKHYPSIVEVYPSRGAICLAPELRRWNALGGSPGPYSEHLLAARGYIIFQPNTEKELTRTPQGPIMGMPGIVLQGVEALVEQGFADPERVGLLGISQGGFSALWMATQTDRFDAIVSINGWSDMYSEYFEGGLLQKFFADESPYLGNAVTYEATTGTDFGLGASPWQDPEVYLRNSPLFNARSVSDPILMIHSDMDAFNLMQYEMMFTALYRQRKEVKFLRYWGEGHGPSSPANIRDMWNRIFAWYDDHLDIARDKNDDLVFDGDRVKARGDAP